MTTIQDIADKMGVSKSTVSKALNDAPDISEALRKQVLETAVALGYTKLRRYKKPTKKVCIIIEKENMRYQEPHHFAYDILVGFRQMARPRQQGLRMRRHSTRRKRAARPRPASRCATRSSARPAALSLARPSARRSPPFRRRRCSRRI